MSSTTTPDKTLEQLIERTRMCAALFSRDLDAMTEEMLAATNGGKSRTGYDLVYEVSRVNRMVAEQAKNNGWDEPMLAGWVTAPVEHCNKATAVENFRDSVESLVMALAQLPPERFNEIVASPMGEIPLIRFAGIVPMHLMYHSGQLNYIQTLHGDDAFHWG